MIQLEVSHLFEAIDKLRIARKISQKDLCQGIMDPSTYSKIKKGDLALNLKDSYEFLSRLNASWADIQSLNLFSDPTIDKLSKEFNRLTADATTPIKNIEMLYTRLSNMDLQNSNLLRLHLLLKKYYADQSNQIPKITSAEMDTLFRRIDISEILTSIDYLLLGDLTTEFSLEQLLKIYPRLLVTNLEEFLIKPRVFKLYIPQCLGNVADIFIDNHYFSEAKQLLNNLKTIAITINSFFYQFLVQYLTLRLQYLETNASDTLHELEKFIKAAKIVYPKSPSIKAFEQSFEDLKKVKKSKPKIIFRTQ